MKLNLSIKAIVINTVFSLFMATGASASDSNGVEIICGIQGSAKVSIKAHNTNPHPMTCTALCTIKNKKDEKVEIKVTDKKVEGPKSEWQILVDKDMPEGPYRPHELNYSCNKQ